MKEASERALPLQFKVHVAAGGLRSWATEKPVAVVVAAAAPEKAGGAAVGAKVAGFTVVVVDTAEGSKSSAMSRNAVSQLFSRRKRASGALSSSVVLSGNAANGECRACLRRSRIAVAKPSSSVLVSSVDCLAWSRSTVRERTKISASRSVWDGAIVDLGYSWDDLCGSFAICPSSL